MQTLFESIAAAELAQHDLVGGPTHVLGAHDFIGITRLEHAILVNARGVGKGVGPDHRLVGLHHKTRGLADHAAGRHDVAGVNPNVQAEIVASRLDGHDHFFE